MFFQKVLIASKLSLSKIPEPFGPWAQGLLSTPVGPSFVANATGQLFGMLDLDDTGLLADIKANSNSCAY